MTERSIGCDPTVPRHVAFIIDGNRRWAREQSKPSQFGHQAGAENIRPIIDAARAHGVETISVFLLSQQNLQNRGSEELLHLNRIIRDTVIVDLGSRLVAEGVHVNFIGKKRGLPWFMRYRMRQLRRNKTNKSNTEGTVNFAINYDGKDEIVRAARKVRRVPWRRMTSDAIERQLPTAGQPPVDLMIRTGGDTRTGGFLLWQAPNAEVHFRDERWPEFTPDHLHDSLTRFSKAERRGGK